MKNKIISLFVFVLLLSSCTSVKVAVDYDKSVSFKTYKTYGFLKEGIDRAQINDLDKRRILRSIEKTLLEKGFTKSEKPDMIVNFFTKENQEVNIFNNSFGNFGYGMGWGWGFYNGTRTTVSNSTKGILYIDLIDNKTKQLFWQGVGKGYLSSDVDQKDKTINDFVSSILAKYPPKIEFMP